MNSNNVLILTETRRSDLVGIVAQLGWLPRPIASTGMLLHEFTSGPPIAGVVLEVARPDLTLEHLSESICDLPVIVLLPDSDFDGAVRAMRRGAFHVLGRPLDTTRLARVLRDAAEEGARRSIRRNRTREAREELASLTEIQADVVDALVAGMTIKGIAASRGVTNQAIGQRRRDAFEKLGVDSVAELTRLVLRARRGDDYASQRCVVSA
ncbi:MAG: hypothetical protein CMJ83_07375 [Planctomycetes bacterium]|nr:hypothetical protein [Planctomycetota bacterium]